MPNIKNTNQVVINNNIKAQDELKILSKLSKMGLLKSQAKQRKRAPSQARMSPQMIPQAPEVGRTAPVSFDRSAVDSQIRAATEEAIRRTAVPSRTNDLENDVRFTNQGSQDIQGDGGVAGTIDVAPEAETAFASGAQEDEGINTELVREQEQEVPDQRPQAVAVASSKNNKDTEEYLVNKIRGAKNEILKYLQKSFKEQMSEDDMYDFVDAIEVDELDNVIDRFKLKIRNEKAISVMKRYKDYKERLKRIVTPSDLQAYFSQGDI
jgi:hypothetical protein